MLKALLDGLCGPTDLPQDLVGKFDIELRCLLLCHALDGQKLSALSTHVEFYHRSAL